MMPTSEDSESTRAIVQRTREAMGEELAAKDRIIEQQAARISQLTTSLEESKNHSLQPLSHTQAQPGLSSTPTEPEGQSNTQLSQRTSRLSPQFSQREPGLQPVSIYNDENKEAQSEDVAEDMQTQEQRIDEFKRIYKETLGTHIDIDDTSCLFLRLNVHGEIIKKIRKLPNIESLTFTHVWWFKEWTRLCKFLKNSCPDSLNQFEFDFSNAGACHYKYQNYHQCLIEIAKKVKNYFSLSFCKLNKEEFEEIIVAAKNCSSIRFFACTIIVGSECDFGDKLTDSKFTELNFDNTGHSIYSAWKTNTSYFRNIFSGLAKCSPVLKTNLQFVNISNCEFDKDLARSILSELEFQDAHV